MVLAVTGVLKILGGLVALALVRPWRRATPRCLRLSITWGVAGLLIVYAGANFVDHVLMEARVRDVPEALGSHALRWAPLAPARQCGRPLGSRE